MAADHFATLGLPRAPWLDAEKVRERFHRLSAAQHPDSPGGSATAFTELNDAWRTLREPATCLRHFIELEHPGTPIPTAVPAELADFFMEIAALKQHATALAAELENAPPLLRALSEPRRIALAAAVEKMDARLREAAAAAAAPLRSGNHTPQALAAISAQLAFIENWQRTIGALGNF